MQDSVVLPNMDDISFFESGLYEHRGGIWSDAARKSPPRPNAAVSTPDDVRSIASVPPPDTAVSGFPAECIASVASKSMDDVNLPGALPTTTVTTDKPPPSVSTVLEESSDVFQMPDSSRSTARRRTWFSSMPGDDSSLLPSANFVTNVNQSEALETRGRPAENTESLRLSRSNSYSSKSSSAHPTTPDRSEDERESSHPSRRSSSQHSVKLEQGSSNQETPNLQIRSTPTTPSRNSDISQIERSPSPPSFFSALKSKAADKQAISNTAKEAMRKWGVNWAGFIKKDEGLSPPRLGSSLEDNYAHKARASYAEIKAAVTERKERERMAQIGDSSDTLQLSSHSATDKPARTRALSSPNEIIHSDTSVNPSAVHLSAPRLSSKRSTSSLGRVNAELDAQELAITEEPVKSPIHIQPQAKTMSIPGIHASHRGEVQSMGYVAPQPQPAPAGPSENILIKNPTIQSVYRLWKTPSGSAGSESETRVFSGDSLATVTTPLIPQAAVKPTPPPLPPRSSSIAIPRTGSETSVDVFSSPSSSASQALKTIVLKDERSRRASIEFALTAPLSGSSNPAPTLDQEGFSMPLETTATGTKGNLPPPLPPRRTPTTF